MSEIVRTATLIFRIVGVSFFALGLALGIAAYIEFAPFSTDEALIDQPLSDTYFVVPTWSGPAAFLICGVVLFVFSHGLGRFVSRKLH